MKEDRRTRKTKNALHQALRSMIMEKEISELSIREVTERADINRKTFYLHYRDLEELIADFEVQLLADMIQALSEPLKQLDGRAIIHDAFLYYAKDPDLYYKLFAAQGYRHVLNAYLEQSQATFDFGKYVPFAKYPAIARNYMFNSLSVIFCAWYEDGQKLSREELANYGTGLIYDGVQ